MDGGRVWGVVIAIAKYFTRRQHMIEPAWDMNKITFNEGPGQDGDHAVDRAHLQRADEAFTDLEVWATFWMLKLLSEFIANIEGFMLSCFCHPKALCKRLGIMGGAGGLPFARVQSFSSCVR